MTTTGFHTADIRRYVSMAQIWTVWCPMKLTSTLQGMTATARLGRCPSADDPGLSTGNSVQKSSLKIVSYIVSSESGLSLAPSGPYQELLLILRRLAEHFAAAACTLASNKGSPCILGTHKMPLILLSLGEKHRRVSHE